MATVTHAEPAAAYRRTRDNDVFRGPHNAPDRAVEEQIWEAHSRVNAHYKKLLSQVGFSSISTKSRAHHTISQMNKDGRNRIVETRKLKKEYIDFIKSSQRFYRHRIQQLDEHYGGIKEIRHAAQMRKKQPGTPVYQLPWKNFADVMLYPESAIAPGIRQKVLFSCYHTLVHLGDLSRYRETAAAEKEYNWGPAVGYYSLAMEIYPDSGMAHNQLAVIALTDGNHFRATYHLYRSLSVKEPYPLAKDNLEREFKKILIASEKGELISKTRLGTPIGPTLVAHFVRLHSKCYKGEDFPEHDELENEVLSQLAVELKERSLEGLLQKITLVNIAAEHYAVTQLQDGKSAALRPFFYFLRLNVKTFFTLLQVLQPELERLTGDDDDIVAGYRQQQPADNISAVARRTLPAVRLYSAWFSKNRSLLSSEISGSLSNVETQQLWKAYAETLTLLKSAFPVPDLPTEDYMLEEDTDTLGFAPLESEYTKKTWFSGDTLKAKWSDEGIGRNLPNVEMLMRVRDLLIDGAFLMQDETVPLAFDNESFIYQEAGVPSELLANLSNKADSPPAAATVDLTDIAQAVTPEAVPDDQMSRLAPSESNTSAIMNKMVDNLVGDDVLDPLLEEDENIPPTPPEQTFMDTVQLSDRVYAPVNAGDLVQQVMNYGKSNRSPATPVRTPVHTPSPKVTQLPYLPPLPYSDDIWNPNYRSSGPSSPLFPPGLEPRGATANGYSVGHSRNHSSASIRTSVPIADSRNGSSATPVGSLPQYQQGYATNGYVPDRRSIGAPPGFGLPAYATANAGMASPLLFGGGGGPFSSDMRRSYSSFRGTPPNGQGG
ncbi:hypothetical protein H2199_007113 [Coniosporium tulheliwenetii]|uniref:Uncharacterized protein n=1 Tax=Coniosporium tulheliwenetii TaxID=3383036 RepID=A0ACC2YTD9_9PEZI|nr:hypothetical protein H2199_007113 [Cladosporium sp. JES 115]